MGANASDSLALTAWLCTHLPRFTESADKYRWRHKLDAVLGDIRDGMAVPDALAKYHLPIDTAEVASDQGRVTKGDPATLEDLDIPQVAVTGPYTCPANKPCGRRADADANSGHEPRCGITGKMMLLRGR